MSDSERPLLGYIKLPENLEPEAYLQKSRIPKYSPTKARKTQNVNEQNEENQDDFPVEKVYICAKCQNVVEPREESPRRNPEPIPISEPTVEPIAEDTAEEKDNKQQSMIMNVMLVLAYILLQPFVILFQYFIRLAKALYAALPILVVAFAIWAYVFEEPVKRIDNAVDELFKDRTEASSSWF